MEANWADIILLAFLTSIAMYIGRLWFKRWFNPLSVYSALWGFCLCNYEMGLIQYYPVSTRAWMYIALAWVSLYLGAATVLLAIPRLRKPAPARLSVDLKRLEKGILILSVI